MLCMTEESNEDGFSVMEECIDIWEQLKSNEDGFSVMEECIDIS